MVNVPRLSCTSSAEIWGVWNSIMGGVLRVENSTRRPTGPRALLGLLRVELDDELLLHGRGDLVALRLAQHLRGEPVVVGLEPCRHDRDELGGLTDRGIGVGAGLHRDHVVGPHLVGGDVHPPAVDGPVTCLLYTSDAADDLLCVDLGGRRIIKKKKRKKNIKTK